MRKIIFVFTLLFPIMAIAAFNVEKWRYFKDISVSGEGIQKVSLDDEVFSFAKENLSDLRIVNGKNEDVPYKLAVSRDKKERAEYYPKMINNSFVDGKSQVILELEEGNREINRLRIITPSENFKGNAKISGSDDMENWGVLGEDIYIYDYTDKKGNFKSQNTTVNFPSSIFKFLKVEISNIEESSIKISSIEAIKYVEEKKREIAKEPKFTINTNKEEKVSEIVLDMGISGIPAVGMAFDAADENFNRTVLIYSSNDNNKWRYRGNGYVFRYNTPKFRGENLKLDFTNIGDRYIKAVIQNKDDQPLDVSGVLVFAEYKEIVFRASYTEVYMLYYGNEKAEFPQYDFDKYFEYLDLDNYSEATLSSQKKNESYVPEKEPEKPLTERSPYIMPAALALACLILLGLVYKFFRK